MQTGDGVEAFEFKSHSGRLEASQRRQVKRSLEKAVAKLPEMRRWTLVGAAHEAIWNGGF